MADNYRNHFLGVLPNEPSCIMIVPSLFNSALASQIQSQYSISNEASASSQRKLPSREFESSEIIKAIEILKSPPLSLKQFNEEIYDKILIIVETPKQEHEIRENLAREKISERLFKIMVGETLKLRQEILQKFVTITLERLKNQRVDNSQATNYLQQAFNNTYKCNKILGVLSTKKPKREVHYDALSERIEKAQMEVKRIRELPSGMPEQPSFYPEKPYSKTPVVLNDSLLVVNGQYEGGGSLIFTIQNPQQFYFSNVFLVANSSKIESIQHLEIGREVPMIPINPLNYIQDMKLCKFYLLYNQVTVSNSYEFGQVRIRFLNSQDTIEVTNNMTMRLECYPVAYTDFNSFTRGNRFSLGPLNTETIPGVRQIAGSHPAFAIFDIDASRHRISNKLWF